MSKQMSVAYYHADPGEHPQTIPADMVTISDNYDLFVINEEKFNTAILTHGYIYEGHIDMRCSKQFIEAQGRLRMS